MILRTMQISLGSATAVAALEPEAAPATCAALAALLPLTTTAHYAKIAGHEFYLHLPLFLEVEHRRAVRELPEGTVAFWPERQFLCVYYGRIQEEDATVTTVGRIVENLPALAAEAEAMRERLGSVIPMVRLAAGTEGAADHAPPPLAAGRSALARQLFAAYEAIRDDVPADVAALVRRHGVLQPAGPLMHGEGETRTLHEVGWLLRREVMKRRGVPAFAEPLLHHFAGRLGGWYGLPVAAALVDDVAATLPGMAGDDARETIEGLILYAGRLSLWLDACIPWTGINELIHGVPQPEAATAGGRRKRGSA